MENEIMEAATKKRRGRPPKFSDITYTGWNYESKRTAQNLHYVGITVIDIMGASPGSFFVTEKGNFRRQGIAEQIGRIYDSGLLDKEQCKELLDTVIQDYENGETVKTIEKNLQGFKQMLKNGG